MLVRRAEGDEGCVVVADDLAREAALGRAESIILSALEVWAEEAS